VFTFSNIEGGEKKCCGGKNEKLQLGRKSLKRKETNRTIPGELALRLSLKKKSRGGKKF